MPGLYVHIPFCIQKCSYCDFISYANMQDHMGAYIDALIKEMGQYSSFDLGSFSTVYIGGGTPSLLPCDLIGRLFQALYKYFSISQNAEVSIECNPGAIQPDALRLYRDIGINRISLGAQSANDALLARIGRIHTKKSVFDTFFLLREAGFQNINIDIMHGLPGQSAEDYLATIQGFCALEPTHVSAYSLILEEHTKLYDAVQAGKETLPEEDAVWTMQDAGIHMLASYGYDRYEVSNFAKSGYACRHNINYWENGRYIGLGAGAHSAWHAVFGETNQAWTRFENPPSLEAYYDILDIPMKKRQKQIIPPLEEAFETIMLGLRMVKGIHIPSFIDRFHAPLASFFPKSLAKLEKNGLLAVGQDHIRATARGMDLLNYVLQEFLLEMDATIALS